MAVCERLLRHQAPAHPVPVDQAQAVREPSPTPPLPPEAPEVPGTPQMPPYLLLNPVADRGEAPARMTDGKVVHPAAQEGVDQLHHPIHGLGLEASEALLALSPQ